MTTTTERREYAARIRARRAAWGRGTVRATPPPRRRPAETPEYRAGQLIIRADAMAAGRHNATTRQQRVANMERERELLAAARNILLGKPASWTERRVVRDGTGSVGIR